MAWYLTFNVSLERASGDVRVAGVLDRYQVISRGHRSVAELVTFIHLAATQFGLRRPADSNVQCSRSGVDRVDNEFTLFAYKIWRKNPTGVEVQSRVYAEFIINTTLQPHYNMVVYSTLHMERFFVGVICLWSKNMFIKKIKKTQFRLQKHCQYFKTLFITKFCYNTDFPIEPQISVIMMFQCILNYLLCKHPY